jgi:hypothetical protein
VGLSTNGTNGNGTTTTHRLNVLERDMEKLEQYTRGLPERLASLEQGQLDLKASYGRLTMAIVGFTLTVAASTIAVLVSVAQQ